MNAPETLDAVQNIGGSLTLNGQCIQYALPDSALWLITELKRNREELIRLLGIVSNVDKFIDATLREVRARLEGKDFLAGNWSLRELIERLEQVGVEIKIDAGNDRR